MPNSSSKAKAMSYVDVVRALNDKDVQADVNDACQRFAHSTAALMERFELVATQLHSVDLHGGVKVPFKPRWSLIQKDYQDIIRQVRAHADCISARLKIFCGVVLPLAARNGGPSRSHEEKIQVLENFASISDDHSAMTRSFVDKALKLSAQLSAFNTEFSMFTSHRSTSGQRELRDLSHKISDFEGQLGQLFMANGRLSRPDVTHLIYSALRVVSTSGRRPGKSRLSAERISLIGSESVTVGRLCEQLDRTRSEVAHLHYAAQVANPSADMASATQKAISALVSDEMLKLEPGLSLFLSIWARLQVDCAEILQFLRNPRSFPDMPSVLGEYLDTGSTLYGPLANALDVCVISVDQVRGKI